MKSPKPETWFIVILVLASVAAFVAGLLLNA
jgi:hypothetical protein